MEPFQGWYTLNKLSAAYVRCIRFSLVITSMPVLLACCWIWDFPVFRLDALAKALSVIATATWLGGWLAGCHTPVLYQNGKTYPKTFSTI